MDAQAGRAFLPVNEDRALHHIPLSIDASSGKHKAAARACRHDNRAMANRKPKGLGLGLEALLGPRVRDGDGADAAHARAGLPSMLKLAQLQPGKYQPRTRMDEGSLYELAESIKSQGVMQPVLVRPAGPERYEIIAGERRFRAARLAGLEEVPVLVKDVPDETAAVMGLIENIQREDLNPLEEAQGLQRLTGEFGLTHEQAAQAVGRSRSAASNLLRLLQLAEPVQRMLMAGDLDMGHARALLALDGAQQILCAGTIAARKLSVREAERLVAREAAGAGRQTPLLRIRKDKSRDIVRLEEELSDMLTAPVEIRVGNKRGKRGEQGELAVGFGSLDELNGVIEKLRKVR
jgi:ParB family chromosome partitioning protein